jgi:hypothetical protein
MRWVEKNHLSMLKGKPKSGLKRSQRKSSPSQFPTSEAMTSVVFVREASQQDFGLNESAPFRQVSISSTFYPCLFLYKSAFGSFSLITLALNIFFERILAQKLLVKCWWNLLQDEVSEELISEAAFSKYCQATT